MVRQLPRQRQDGGHVSAQLLAPHMRVRRAGSTEIVGGGGGGGGELTWPNEPAGLSEIVETDWQEPGFWDLIGTDEEWTGNGWVRKIDENQADAMEIITIGDHPISGMTKVFRARAPTLTDGGFGPFAYSERNVSTGHNWRNGCRELYYGYWHRIVTGFEGHASGSNKSFDVRVYNGTIVQSHWNIPWGAGFLSDWDLRYDATAGASAGCTHTAASIANIYETNVWTQFEGHIILPTTDGATGTWKIWKNGSLVLNRTDICDQGTNAWMYGCLLSATWGGLNDELTHDNDQHFGPIRLSGASFQTP